MAENVQQVPCDYLIEQDREVQKERDPRVPCQAISQQVGNVADRDNNLVSVDSVLSCFHVSELGD